MAEPLTANERQLLSARADQFFSACQRGSEIDWDTFLADLTGPVRSAVIIELIQIDLEHRWKNGRAALLEEYIARFPELGGRDQIPAKLIQEEYRWRTQSGDVVPIESYEERFPLQFASIRDALMTMTVKSKVTPKTGVTSSRTREGFVSVAQNYELIRQLGRGMFGEVWLARKNPSGIEKAIKILLHPIDDDGAKRELRSLELIKNLRHPYLLATEDFWVSDNRLHIAMELADSTVRNRYKQCQSEGMAGLPPDELLQYISEAAEGLDYLHEQKITHRDVKPDNILLLRGHAKVADFGLARQQENVMASMSFAGTPAYMAPEVWGGEGGPASDQYSLAFVALELLQGQSPLKLGPMAEMMLAHLDGKYEFTSMISEAERQVFRKALSRQPHDRYPSCSAFAIELARAMGKTSMRMPVSRATSSYPTPSTRTSQKTETASSSTPIPLTTVLGSVIPGDQTTRTNQPSHTAIGTLVNSVVNTQIKGPASVTIRRPRAKKASNLPLILGLSVVLLGGVTGIAILILGGGDKPQPTSASTTQTLVDPTTPTTHAPPLSTGEFIPTGATAEPTAKRQQLANERLVPEWIQYTIGSEKVRFRFIRGGNGIPPFFISECKIWNAAYRSGGGQIRGEPIGGDLAPVVNVSAAQAWDFGSKSFGGRLPTHEEWDVAAGYEAEGKIGPIWRPGGEPWIKQAEPGSVRRTNADKNLNDLIDMAGNGREWTSSILVERGKPVRIVSNGQFEMKELVIVRGRRYTLSRGLDYDAIRYEQTEPQTEFAGNPSPYTSFRVVVPIP